MENEPLWLKDYRKRAKLDSSELGLESRPLFFKYIEKEDELYFDKDEIIKNTEVAYKNANKDTEVMSLEKFEREPEILKKFKNLDKIHALLNSYFDSALFIKFNKDTKSEGIFRILQNINSHKDIKKIVVLIEKGSKAYLTDEVYCQLNAYAGQNIDILVEEDAELNLLLLSRSEGRSVINQNIINNGKVNVFSLNAGGGMNRNRLWVNLKEHSEFCLYQALIGKQNGYFDLESEIIHSEKNTTSNVEYKAVLNDSSKAIYKGVIRQEKPAINSYAYLSEHSLILNKNARSISVPSLEIETNELKAYHSASSQPLDKTLLFYAMSRGIEEDLSTKMIADGFISSIFRKIENEEFNNILFSQLENEFIGLNKINS